MFSFFNYIWKKTTSTNSFENRHQAREASESFNNMYQPAKARDSFDIVYQAAKDKNLAVIMALPRSSIDVYDVKEDHTPISKLAAENDDASVAFLRKHAQSKLHLIAYGLAHRKKKTAAYQFLQMVAREHPAQLAEVLRHMAFALPKSTRDTQIKNFLRFVQKNYYAHYKTIAKEILCGLARSGKINEAHASLKTFENYYTHDEGAKFLAWGFANGNHQHAAFEMLRKLIDPAERDAVLLNIAVGFTAGGYKNEAWEAFARIKDPALIQLGLRAMAAAFAQIGYLTECCETLARIETTLYEALGPVSKNFIKMGHTNACWDLLATVKAHYANYAILVLQEMAECFALCGSKVEVDTVLDMIETEHPYSLLPALEKTALSYVQNSDEDETYEILKKAALKYPLESTQLAKMMHEIARSFAENHALTAAYAFLKHVRINYSAMYNDVLIVIAESEKKINKSIERTLVLNALVLTNEPSAQQTLAQRFAEFTTPPNRHISSEIQKLLLTANHYQYLMNKWDLDFYQAAAWDNQTITLLLFQFKSYVNSTGRHSLDRDIVLMIAAFLVPVAPSDWESFTNKFAFQNNYHDCQSQFFERLPRRALIAPRVVEDNVQQALQMK